MQDKKSGTNMYRKNGNNARNRIERIGTMPEIGWRK